VTEKVFPAAIFFDMDGLLVDSEPVWFRAESDLARSIGAPWTHEDALGCVGAGLSGVAVQLAHKAGMQPDVEALVGALIERFLAHVEDIAPKPGAVALIDAARARGVPIALATSSPRLLAERVLTGLGLLARFGATACGDEVPAPKPDPAVYLLAAERLGVSTEGALVLEDSLAGAQAGRRAGATVYAVPEGDWRGRGYEAWSDVICTSLADVQARLGW
jgi:HAD superfamily hydrolase (TIGR01509 family)